MHIVTLGSGTGQATLLRGLRAYACQVTAIVGVTDNGGHSGELRRILDQPQVGDTRQCLSALVDETSVWGKLLQYRFATGELRGLSVGNLMLAALSSLHGSFAAAVAELSRAAGLRQRLLPVSDANAHIAAELQDGRQLLGEWEIIQRQPRSDVVRLYLQPAAAALPAVLDAIASADIVVLCPGSLLTGLIPVLLHDGVCAAMAATSAWCLYVCNLMTQPGQTDDYSAAQHLACVHRYLGRRVDAMLLNTGAIPAALLHDYAEHGSRPVRDDVAGTEVAVYRVDLTEHPTAERVRRYQRPQGERMQAGLHVIRHDTHKLVAQIMALALARQAEAAAPSRRVFR